MSESRQQVFIDAPVPVVWELIHDVDRHPEWWPRILEVECDEIETGCTYRQVTQTPIGRDEMLLRIDRLEDCEELLIRCVNTGTFVQFVLTEAQGGTFVDGKMGMDPATFSRRVFDATLGKRYFRNWLAASLDALRAAASGHATRAA